MSRGKTLSWARARSGRVWTHESPREKKDDYDVGHNCDDDLPRPARLPGLVSLDAGIPLLDLLEINQCLSLGHFLEMK